jgi:hypothetical protein
MTEVKKQVAGSVVIAFVVGAGLVFLLFHARPDTSQPSQGDAAKSHPDLITAKPPGEAAIDTVPSPASALTLLNEAFSSNDPELYAKNHLPGTQDEEAYANAVKAVLAAQRRLVAAFKTKVDPNDISSLPAGSFYIKPLTDEQLRSMKVTRMDDHTADVKVPHFPRYRVVLVGREWHIQLTPTLASVYPSDPARAMQVLTRMFHDIADAFDRTTAEITQGQLTNQGEIFNAITARVAAATQASTPSLPPAVSE